MEEQKIFVCACHSYSHQAFLSYDRDDKELCITIHLITYRNFFKRLWIGLKYAFGYTSNYGEWDSFIFKEEDEQKLLDYLNQIKIDNSRRYLNEMISNSRPADVIELEALDIAREKSRKTKPTLSSKF